MEVILNGAIAFFTLALMEVVLGIDNVIFISILSSRLPQEKQAKARLIGLSAALVVRVILLIMLAWLMHFNQPLFNIGNFDVSARDIILILGGLFLLYKSTIEIHQLVEGEEMHAKKGKVMNLATAVFQIILLDIVFSFDSILTAIGLSDEIYIMVAAVVFSMIIMLLAAKRISEFILQNPTVKMLALAFLLMIGLLLVIDGFHVEVPKGYIYFGIFFSLFVELLNMRARKKRAQKETS